MGQIARSQGIERELKLLVAKDDLQKAQAALLTMAGRPRPTRSGQVSIYYDTEDRALRRSDVVLRVRRKGRSFIQTVKSSAFADEPVLTRGEWEDRVSSERPDLTALVSGSHLPAVLTAEALQPLFATEVKRTSFVLRPLPEAEIAVAIDRGEIRAEIGEAVEPIHEVELELRRGDPVVLWDVALRLLEIVPVRIGTMSKSERGYTLVGDGMRRMALHAATITLGPDMTLDAAFRAIGRSCASMIMHNEAAASVGLAEGVHQMRVGVRRFRAALAALKPMLPKEHHAWANGELRWLSTALGPARNWDVFAEELLTPVSSALSAEGELARLRSTADKERRGAYENARAAIASERYTALMMRLCRWLDASGWRDQPVSEDSARLMEPLGDVVPVVLGRLHRKALKRSRKFKALDPVQRHRLRIALKKLRYAVEFFQSIYDRRDVKRYVDRLKPLQDALGHANDVRSAHALIASLDNGAGTSLERAAGIVVGWHDRGLAEAEEETRRHVRRFRDAEPFW